jgi:hypothetical protein
MEKQKTAVEWLMENISYDNGYGGRNNSFTESFDLSDFFKKAKEMEKEQIINAVEWGNRKGYDEHTLTCIYDEDLKYYNETYTQSSE